MNNNTFVPYTVIIAAFRFCALAVFLCAPLNAFGQSYTKQNNGVLMNAGGHTIKIQVCSSSIFRIVSTRKSTIPPAAGFCVIKEQWPSVQWDVRDDASLVYVTTAAVETRINKSNGAISFYMPAGKEIVAEKPGSKIAEAKKAGIEFTALQNEGIYGFGQQGSTGRNNGASKELNQKDLNLTLVQANKRISIPFYISTRGYGILLNCFSKITKTAPLKFDLDWTPDQALDYYFMYGPQFDSIIAHYREITGRAPLNPKWSLGYIQCKAQYGTQQEIVNAFKEYRKRSIPLDMMVQDWDFWASGGNGSFQFDQSRYPDPADMIKTFHDGNCHYMITAWPGFQSGNSNYTEMKSKGYLFDFAAYKKTFIYDAYNESAGKLFWDMLNRNLFSIGVDAWWFDATEPEVMDKTLWSIATTSIGPAAQYLNVYSMAQCKNTYEGQRAANPDKRVFILTRSAYAGQQRYGAASWSGDIQDNFNEIEMQIPLGLNFCASGIPYWTTDIGGWHGGDPSDALYRETFVRWFQYGAFCPLFRNHGRRTGNKNELWDYGDQALPILIKYDKLRYRLMPYIYSLAWKVTNDGYTIMRALPFDFMADKNTYEINDQFMFGPSILVNPVHVAGATSRQCYLPAGIDWYDFWTGEKIEGGKTVTADAPLDKLPLFVKAGSILPMGPEIQYALEKSDPIELRIYPGADGEFTLYEDEGDTYNYENGKYSTIALRWNNSSRKLGIGSRNGSFNGMLQNRNFNIALVDKNKGIGAGVSTSANKAITYSGTGVEYTVASGEVTAAHAAQNAAMSPKITISAQAISITAEKAGCEIVLTTLAGRIIRTFTPTDGQLRIDIAQMNLPKGTYFLIAKKPHQKSVIHKLFL